LKRYSSNSSMWRCSASRGLRHRPWPSLRPWGGIPLSVPANATISVCCQDIATSPWAKAPLEAIRPRAPAGTAWTRAQLKPRQGPRLVLSSFVGSWRTPQPVAPLPRSAFSRASLKHSSAVMLHFSQSVRARRTRGAGAGGPFDATSIVPGGACGHCYTLAKPIELDLRGTMAVPEPAEDEVQREAERH
jgi:hypothetical protein